MQRQLVDAKEELGRTASGHHQVVLVDRQQLRPCGMRPCVGILRQGIHCDHQVVTSTQNVEDAHSGLI